MMILYVMLLIGLLSPALSQKPFSNPLDNLVPSYGPDLISSYSEDQAQYDGDQSAAPVMSGIDMLRMAVPGDPGEDYPILSEVPETSFSCDGRIDGGYYADVEAECQPFHVCTADGDGGLSKYSFLCPNGTLFNQAYFVCEYWFNVDCSVAESFYSLNEELGNSEGFLDTSASSPSGGYTSPLSEYTSSADESQNYSENENISLGEYSPNTRTGRIQGGNRQVQGTRSSQSQEGQRLNSSNNRGNKRNGRKNSGVNNNRNINQQTIKQINKDSNSLTGSLNRNEKKQNSGRQNKLTIRPPQKLPNKFNLPSKQTNKNSKNASFKRKGKQSSSKNSKDQVRKKINIKQTRNGRQRNSPETSYTQPSASSSYLSPEQQTSPASNSYLPPSSDIYTASPDSVSINQNSPPSQQNYDVDGSNTLADYDYEETPLPTYSGASPTAGQSNYVSQSSSKKNARKSKNISLGQNKNKIKGGNSKLKNKKGNKPFQRSNINQRSRKFQNKQGRNGRQGSPSTGYLAPGSGSPNLLPKQPTSTSIDSYLPPSTDTYTLPADSYTKPSNQNNKPLKSVDDSYVYPTDDIDGSDTFGDYDYEEVPLPTYSGASPTAGQSNYISQSNVGLQTVAQSSQRNSVRKSKQILLRQNKNKIKNGNSKQKSKSFRVGNRNNESKRSKNKQNRKGKQNSPNTDYAAPTVSSSNLSPAQPAAPASVSYLPPSSDIYTSPTNQNNSPSESYIPFDDSYRNEDYDDSNSNSDYEYEEAPLPTYSGASPTAGQSKYISQPINSEYTAENEQNVANINNDDYEEDILPSYNNGVYNSGSGDNYSAPPSDTPEQIEYRAPTKSEYGAPPESKYGSPANNNFGFQTNSEYGTPPESEYGAPSDVTAESGYTGPKQDIGQTDVLPEYYKSEIGLGLAQANDVGEIDPFTIEDNYTASSSDPVASAVVPEPDLTYGVPQAPTISLTDYHLPDVSDKGYRGGGGSSYGR